MRDYVVIAFIDGNTCQAFRTKEDAPAGSTVFESPQELAGALTVESMDRIRGRLLGQIVGKSSSSEEAGKRLWYTLLRGVDLSLRMVTRACDIPPKKDGMGYRRNRAKARIEMIELCYVSGTDPMTEHFLKKLRRQGRIFFRILLDDGRKVWTAQEFKEMIDARFDEMNSHQGVVKLTDFYRCTLIGYKVLRKLTYLEFFNRPDFAALSKHK